MKHLFLLAMGPTWYQIPQPEHLPPDSEVWTINTMFKNYSRVDRVFMMHDIRTEILLQDYNFINLVNDLNVPVYTAGNYEALKNNVIFPVEEIVNEFKVGFFLNSITYMIALGISEKPLSINLFGIDMRPDSGFEWHQEEKGAVEFWLGVATGRGIKITIPEQSYIMKRQTAGYFYGYRPRLDPNGLVHLVPGCDRRQYNRYQLTPIDDEGNALEDPIIVTPQTHSSKRQR